MKYLAIGLATFLLSSTSCEKEDPSIYTEADYARCAHVSQSTPSGQFLYGVCLNNPWPAELPPATQEGLSTFGCWINDTLAFVAGDPREPARNTAKALFYPSTGHFNLSANYNTYSEIDPRSIYIAIRLNMSQGMPKLLSNSEIRFYDFEPFTGNWTLDTLKSSIALSLTSDKTAFGTYELNFYKPNTSDTLRLSTGRFDVRVSEF